MTATYTDIIDAMIEAQNQDSDIDRVVLTSESMDTFLMDENFTKAKEQEVEDTIGDDWELQIETGDGDYLRMENGSRIHLE